MLMRSRYEIAEGAPGWAEAEKQVKKGRTVVAVSGNAKRKQPVETAEEIYEQEFGDKAHKKSKKGKKDRA
jgi:N-acetyltransferase 10